MPDPTDTTTLTTTGPTNCDGQENEPTVETHPEYKCKQADYQLIDDCLEGEKQIKKQGDKYLPKTSAQQNDDPQGKAYTAYKTRAIYYNYPLDVLSAGLGMLQREPSTFEPIPANIQPLEDSATADNEPFNEVLSDINQGQISYGGMGLLVDVPASSAGPVEGNVIPYLVEYPRNTIVNWEEEKGTDGRNRLRMVTLNESAFEIQTGGSHEWVEKYRMCALDEDGDYWTGVLTEAQIGQVDTKTFNPPKFDENDNPYPSVRGNTLKYIPFVSINVSDLRIRPQVSPILDICDLSIALYRATADHKQALFMQGQATPWVTGITKEEGDKISVLGATALLKANNPQAKFGFMEVEGEGLAEMREDSDDLKETIASKGVALLDTTGTESGKALSIRSGSKTAFLKTIAITAAQGMRVALTMAASWMEGKDPSDITVEELNVVPNLDFTEDDTSNVPDELLKLQQFKAMGGVLSAESIHAYASRKDVTTMSFEDEMAELNGDTTV
jgi:hypothetical protein